MTKINLIFAEVVSSAKNFLREIRSLIKDLYFFVKNNPKTAWKIGVVLALLFSAHYGFLKFNTWVHENSVNLVHQYFKNGFIYNLNNNQICYIVIFIIIFSTSWLSVVWYNYKKRRRHESIIKVENYKKRKGHHWFISLLLLASSPFAFIEYARGLRNLVILYFLPRSIRVQFMFMVSNVVTSFGSYGLVLGYKIKPILIVLAIGVLTVIGYFIKNLVKPKIKPAL